MQFAVGEAGVPDFRKTLEPMRQLLAEYPYLGGKDGPSYADHFVAGMFMVGPSSFIPLSVCSIERDLPEKTIICAILPWWVFNEL